MDLSWVSQVFGQTFPSTLTLTGVCIDSRQVQPGHLFVALLGERFDGHDFVEEALHHGAVAVLASKPLPNISVPVILVLDTFLALRQLAHAYRKICAIKTIALTGSNGKTSVKEMISCILPSPAFSSRGNLNNHIGVPLSILQVRPEDRYAVFELGANHIGEIAQNAELVAPQVVLVNNIGPAHIGEFGSIEGVACAKGEIYQALSAEGIAVVNDDDAYAHFWDSIIQEKAGVWRFSVAAPTEEARAGEKRVYASKVSLNEHGCVRFILHLPDGSQSPIQLQVTGLHMLSNALAAASATAALGISSDLIVQGLQTFTGVAGRLTLLPGKNGSILIDDSYNANLASTLAALAVLAHRPGKRIFVFGDMGELGEWTQEHHEVVGRTAREYNIEGLMTCGTHSKFASAAFGVGATHFATQAELVTAITLLLDANTSVLLKGSRSSRIEHITQQLMVVSEAADAVSSLH
ncbi:MAG: UDP-N-acetylmuramoyl-tripeptide--D-alanyl-D-alanine ligase [Legionellaceae bacterium]|nr:UDP-N-acetylmuramoyl-tripeptide--D-alanyl-D-alanine ligase [Legionellaceae bacterium]